MKGNGGAICGMGKAVISTVKATLIMACSSLIS